MKKPRSEWGPGPWQNEPDGLRWPDQKTGLHCMAVRNKDVGTWCGYVGLEKDHPLFGKERPDLGVHGGVTFAGYWKDDSGGNLWWIGFDCAHAGDYMPAFPMLGDKEHYKTLDYVKAECANLASQLRDEAADDDLALEEVPL